MGRITMSKLKFSTWEEWNGSLVLTIHSQKWIFKKSISLMQKSIWFLKNIFRIYGYAATWTADAVFIFGGYYSKSQAVIAKYSNDEWSNEGSLIQGRYSHAAISHNGVTLIIGGSTDDGKPWVFQPKFSHLIFFEEHKQNDGCWVKTFS